MAVHYSQEPNYENQALIQKRMNEAEATAASNSIFSSDQYSVYPNAAPNQYNLYYPKPYSAANTTVKPIVAKQPPHIQMLQQQQPRSISTTSNQQNVRYAQQQPQQQNNNGANSGSGAYRIGYNQNHWLLQEAELRRQIDSIESSSNQRLKINNANSGLNNTSNGNGNNNNSNVAQQQQQPVQPPQGNPKGGGYLSVSGKKKCSSCMDELGKGCAAMVVESLSLYYHINCFRCSVCNVQLGKCVL